jgi:hypothetical protein
VRRVTTPVYCRVVRRLVLVFLLAVAACANGLLAGGQDAGNDGTVGDGGACPQFDLKTDPQHCGSCTNACGSGQVCSSGMCASQCTSPTTKCASVDGGNICATLATDPKHCGQCTNACTLGDAGGIPPGTNNPDSGIPNNGGIDAGAGWATGTPSCDASTCGVACPPGMTSCNGVCFDMQNHHDHCGTCTTACASTDWCNSGNCCAPGQEWCGTACVDVLSNNASCGSCTKACSGSTPYCSNGTCVMGCVPSGTRQSFTTLMSHTSSGCWNGNPCAYDTYSWSSTDGQNFQAVGQNVVCSGTTACVGHVGITTYTGTTTVCQGSWDVYCDAAMVGTINTLGKTCGGSAMSNGCDISFTPATCSTIKLVAQLGTGTNGCCGGTSPDTMVTAISAW